MPSTVSGFSIGISTLFIFGLVTALKIPYPVKPKDAATIPTVYATCYYALFCRANLKKNNTIFGYSALWANNDFLPGSATILT